MVARPSVVSSGSNEVNMRANTDASALEEAGLEDVMAKRSQDKQKC